MVLMHALRCLRFLVRGRSDRQRALSAYSRGNFFHGEGSESVLLRPELVSRSFDEYHLFVPLSTSAYCGLRTVDMNGHVNNAKYLELLEYARWHQLSFLNLGPFTHKRKIAYVLSDVSIQYVREIKPFSTVHITTQMDCRSTTRRRAVVRQTIWNADQTAVCADAVMQVALVGPAAYNEHLRVKYGGLTPIAGGGSAAASESASASAAAAAKPARRYVPLDWYQVLADFLEQPNTAGVEEGFRRSRSTTMPPSAAAGEGGGPAAAAAQSAPSGADWQEELTAAEQKWRQQIRHMRFTSSTSTREGE